MRDLTTKFGQNAGEIWKLLNERGPLTKEEIQESTKQNDDDFFVGIGWLAREDKISVDEKNHYRLSSTNLTPKIGRTAGRIWRILDIWEEADISTMKRLSEVDESQIQIALGWLAREDKICVNEKEKFNLK
jgi:rRNA pseudouridine-1189 N-methylase Emg1 (Nep1/Mra1 family)